MKTARMNEFAERFFTDAEGVRTYLPINVKVSTNTDGTSKKMPIGSRQSFRYANFKELKETEITHYVDSKGETKAYELEGINDGYMLTYANCSFYELSLSSTKGIFVIDIDDTEQYTGRNDCLLKIPEVLRDMPYTLSTTKNLPHFFFMLDEDMTNRIANLNVGSLGSDNLNFCKGDFLCSAIWEKKDKLIFNWDDRKPLKVLSCEELCSLLSEELVNKIMGSSSKKQEQITITLKPIAKDDDDDDDDITTLEEEEEEPLQIEITHQKSQSIPEKVLNRKLDLKTINTIKKLEPCWKRTRLTTYDGFLKFTFAIQHIFTSKDIQTDAMTLWNDICKKFEGYDEHSNMRMWGEISTRKRSKEEKTIGMGTLIFWAKEDNYELFDTTFNKDNIDWTRLTDATFADKLCDKRFLGKNVIFTGQSKDMEGFKYNGVYWEQLGTHNALLKKDYFEKLYKFYSDKFQEVMALFEEKAVKGIQSNLKALDSAVCRNHIIDVVKTNNYQANIKWNTHHTYFAFNDKVFDLETNSPITPLKEHYINITCGYDFGNSTDEYSTEIADIMSFLRSMFENENVVEYMLKVMASFLRGQNIDEKIYFWLGQGRNGKGTLTTLLQNALGSYYGTLNLTYYTEYKRGEDSANNNLYLVRYARLLNTAEVGEGIDPTKPQRFLTDKLKTLTGNDPIRARQNFSRANEDVEFRAGTSLVQTNIMPQIIGIEKKENISLRDRVRICPFPYSFTDDAVLLASNPRKYKPIDKTLKDKFQTDRYRNAFIRLLMTKYIDYIRDGLTPPPEVIAETNKYFDSSDKVKSWFFENLEEIEENMVDSSEKICIPSEAYGRFIEITGEKMTKGKFKDALEELLGKCGKTKNSRGVAHTKGFHYIKGYKWCGETNEGVDEEPK